MTPQHLSDEAVAAYADGVLGGHARDRASRHIAGCTECREAVRGQREAAWALRAAPAPHLPGGLLDRLRTVPQTTALPTALPTAMTADGTTMFRAVGAAALVPDEGARGGHRAWPYVATAAVMVLAGAVVAGSVAAGQDDGGHGNGTSPVARPVQINQVAPAGQPLDGMRPVQFHEMQP
jgi:anti-sigma factor RsiW